MADDFRRVGRRFPVVALATAGQIVLWPLAAVALLAVLPLKPYVAVGIVLAAASPSSGMANFYSFLGRANLGLSIVLTAISCLAAALTMPLVLALFPSRPEGLAPSAIPIPLLIGQLLLLLVAPIAAGMGAGAIPFLAKPFEEGSLLDAVARALRADGRSRRRGRRVLRRGASR